jgi:hypothetical protein
MIYYAKDALEFFRALDQTKDTVQEAAKEQQRKEGTYFGEKRKVLKLIKKQILKWE